MKKFVLVVTLGLAVLLCISMTISAWEKEKRFTFRTVIFPNNFTPENFPGSAQTQVIGINNRGFTDGFYIDTAGTTHGFLDVNGTFTTVDFPPFTFNQLLGLNNFDQAAGYYADAAGIDH